MLKVIVPKTEYYNELTEEFINVPEESFQIEHSLVSVSKWESKWCKPFMEKSEKTREETLDYIRCMTVTQNVNPEIYKRLPDAVIKTINDYIDSPMTATWFREDPNIKKNREIITSEVIYYRLVALNIPFECQKWHLNRLLTLIRVCDEKNRPPSKRGRKEMLSSRATLNAQRRNKYNTKG